MSLISSGLRIVSEDGLFEFLRRFAKFIVKSMVPVGIWNQIYIINARLKLSQKFESNSSFSMVFASKNRLDGLSDKYGTDKGGIYSPVDWETHSYTPIYDLIFGHLDPNILVECGIGTDDPDKVSTMGPEYSPGASLRMWKDYFPDTEIIGIDIDEQILFEEDRISTHLVDQTNEASINNFISKYGREFEIDIVIDDGLHTSEGALNLFSGLFPHLVQQGIYIIEDLKFEHVNEVLDVIENKYNVESVHVIMNSQDSLIIIRK
jgi:hypothetical protein